jgi:hypothetical protein
LYKQRSVTFEIFIGVMIPFIFYAIWFWSTTSISLSLTLRQLYPKIEKSNLEKAPIP